MADAPSDAAALKDEGNKLFAAENYLKAAATYTQAIKIDGANAVLYSNRSAALLKLKKVAKALEDADKCIELRPDWDKGYFRKGSVLEDQSKLPEALAMYQLAYKLNPESKELATKIRLLSRLCSKQGSKQPVAAETAAAEAPVAEPASHDSTPAPTTPAESPPVFEDLGSESVAEFAEEHLVELAEEIKNHGMDFIPLVHLLPGPKPKLSDDAAQPHIRGAGAWETPQMLQEFMKFIRKGAKELDAEAMIALVPKSAIGWPQTWTKPKWPCGDEPGVFVQLESRQVFKCWWVPVQGPPWAPGTPVTIDAEIFGPLPGRMLE